MSERPNSDPHRNQPVVHAGADLTDAKAAVILLHGRGATAEGILSLAGTIGVDGVAYLAPQAAGSQWYPRRFVEPVEQNEPWLSSALALVARQQERLAEAGIDPSKVVVGGFSQGACLAVEYVGRNPRRYGGAFAFSGGLIGDELEAGRYPEGLAGTPIFMGCSDRDAHIPEERVHASASILEARGADLYVRIYPGMPHTVNDDEVEAVRAMLQSLMD
jgi:predicted esterase